MHLMNLSWQETESYLQQHKSIILPIGSFEQHGPNGRIGSDPSGASAEFGAKLCAASSADVIEQLQGLEFI